VFYVCQNMNICEHLRVEKKREFERGGTRAAIVFSSWCFWRSQKQVIRKKKCCRVREENRDKLPFIPAKEEFVYLFFVFYFENNLSYVIVRFECIRALESE
jgi:hypothetical protein